MKHNKTLKLITLILSICVIIANSHANEDGPEEDELQISPGALSSYRNLKYSKINLEKITGSNANQIFNIPEAQRNDQEKQCLAAYGKLFQQEVVRVSIVLGYLDAKANSTVMDPFFKEAFLTAIQAPCTPGISLCEFRQEVDAPDQFSKQVKFFDNGRQSFEKTITIEVYQSAASINHYNNTNDLKYMQQLHSQFAEQQFNKALQNSDIVFYFGHARYGSGPGFKPLEKYSWEWITSAMLKPQLTTLQRLLKTSQKKPKILGLVACQATEYYGYSILNAAPNIGLLMPNQTTSVSDAETQIFAVLNSLLNTHCSEPLNRSIETTTRSYYHNKWLDGQVDLQNKRTKLYNFFTPAPKIPKAWFLSPRIILSDESL